MRCYLLLQRSVASCVQNVLDEQKCSSEFWLKGSLAILSFLLVSLSASTIL